MAEPFIGELKIFAGNFAPIGWMMCAGQLLPISQYDALFNLIGTTYGGDGMQTFALPDLRGRVAIGQGQGPALPNYTLGQAGGAEQVTLTVANMGAHSHQVIANGGGANTSNPSGALLAATSGPAQVLYGPASNLAAMNGTAVGAAGGSQPHDNMQPSLVLNWIIAVEGIYPSQG